jgi:K+-sensing histidine kinase KdpD
MIPRLTRDILRRRPVSYALAVLIPATAVLMLRGAGVGVDRLPSAPLLAAVLAVAWYCGRLPALLATVISIAFHAYVLVLSPRQEIDGADVVGVVLFAGLAIFVSYATPRLGQTLRELEHERQLEQIARTDAERHSREADELRRLSRALTHTASPVAAAQRVADAVSGSSIRAVPSYVFLSPAAPWWLSRSPARIPW